MENQSKDTEDASPVMQHAQDTEDRNSSKSSTDSYTTANSQPNAQRNPFFTSDTREARLIALYAQVQDSEAEMESERLSKLQNSYGISDAVRDKSMLRLTEISLKAWQNQAKELEKENKLLKEELDLLRSAVTTPENKQKKIYDSDWRKRD